MRIMPLLQAACLSLMLSACVAPLLMMSPTSQLMWALLKPLVGFDPNEANLFEQPLIKDRMTAMLGPNYDSTMQLLKTANELQQEGPLFYVVSRYAPVPDVAKQAGMVWNADTNQLSVMLQKGDGATQVFGENLTTATPTWPSTMQEWQAGNPTATALSGVGQAMTGSGTSLLGNMVGSLQQSATQAISSSASQAVNGATSAATQQVNKSVTGTLQQANQAVTDSAKRAVSDTATAQQQASKALSNSAKQAASSATTAQQQASKVVSGSATQAASSATTAQQQASKAVSDSAKQAASSATTTVQQQANKTVSDASATVQPQADKAVSNAVSTVHKQADAGADKAIKQSDQARADAEAELEKLLN
ncbi:hypothetical protein [Aeromonas media]|uniref:hypothetical protein n=1 Tax=Aeromonas media TaxID=651 RepID=UPI003CFC7CEE